MLLLACTGEQFTVLTFYYLFAPVHSSKEIKCKMNNINFTGIHLLFNVNEDKFNFLEVPWIFVCVDLCRSLYTL